MGILRGFCTHVWKAALGNNCCVQHAISGNLPSSAVMFLNLPWFSDSKLPFPSLLGLVHGVLFPFLLSICSMTLDKAVQCLSVVSSFTQRPSRPVWDCFAWKKRILHFNCKHVGFGWRWSFNLQLYNRRRFCCRGRAMYFWWDCGRLSGPSTCLDPVIRWPWDFASGNKSSALFLVRLSHALVSFPLCRLKQIFLRLEEEW